MPEDACNGEIYRMIYLYRFSYILFSHWRWRCNVETVWHLYFIIYVLVFSENNHYPEVYRMKISNFSKKLLAQFFSYQSFFYWILYLIKPAFILSWSINVIHLNVGYNSSFDKYRIKNWKKMLYQTF